MKVDKTCADNFQPELTSDKSLLADAQVAKYKSSKAQAEDALMIRADENRYNWNKVPEEDVRTFLEHYETPEAQRSPDLRARYSDVENRFPFVKDDAPLIQKWLFDSYMSEKEFGSRADYLMNYFPHLWEKPQEAQRLFENAMNSPMGPTWFQKARYYDLIEHGLNNGLRLKSYNPIDLVTQRLMSGADMMEKMKLLDGFHKDGMAVPKTEAPSWILSP